MNDEYGTRPNPMVVNAILKRVAEFKREQDGMVCPDCNGELRFHPSHKRMCGCLDCGSVFRYPSLVRVATMAEGTA